MGHYCYLATYEFCSGERPTLLVKGRPPENLPTKELINSCLSNIPKSSFELI